MAKIQWHQEVKTENLLKELEIPFEIIKNYPVKDIDWDEGLKHQVRLEKERLMDEVVFRYATDMEKPNASFPYCIMQRDRKDKKVRYWPWSGNHRGAACQAALIETIDFYAVEVHDPVLVSLLPRQVNAIEAVKGMSREEAILHARHLIETHHMGVEAAARKFGLKREMIYKARRAEATKKKIEELKIPTNGFSQVILDKLHGIPSIDILGETATILHRFKVKGDDALAIIKDVKDGNSETLQRSTLKKWEGALAMRYRPKKGKGAVDAPFEEVEWRRFSKLLASARQFALRNHTKEQAQISDPARLQAMRECWKVVKPAFDDLLS